jgi:hypothetical protein
MSDAVRTLNHVLDSWVPSRGLGHRDGIRLGRYPRPLGAFNFLPARVDKLAGNAIMTLLLSSSPRK